MKKVLGVQGPFYAATVAALAPLARLMARRRGPDFEPGSVLHVSYAGAHLPRTLTRALRAEGGRADWLAIGTAASDADHRLAPSRVPPIRAIQEFALLWRVTARFEFLHLHFMISGAATGWDVPLLVGMGRKVIAHWEGCELRDREAVMRRSPAVNICQECDYGATICRSTINQQRVALARRHAALHYVSTRDMLDFAPWAEFLPLPAPGPDEAAAARGAAPPRGPAFRVVHATNHPGIEGTRQVVAAVEEVRRRGCDLELVVLHGADRARVLAELAAADVTVSKMKMGYYATFAVEGMALGAPAITWIRPDLRPQVLDETGLIVTTLDGLADVLEQLIREPELLERKRRLAPGTPHMLGHELPLLARRLLASHQRLARDQPSPSSRRPSLPGAGAGRA